MRSDKLRYESNGNSSNRKFFLFIILKIRSYEFNSYLDMENGFWKLIITEKNKGKRIYKVNQQVAKENPPTWSHGISFSNGGDR